MERVELEAAIADGLSQRKIAERFGLAGSGPVSYWMKKYDLHTLPEARKYSPWAKYTVEVLEEAVSKSTTINDVLRHLGMPLVGGSHQHVSRRLKTLEIDTSHFTGKSSLIVSDSYVPYKKTLEQILVCKPKGSARTSILQLRRALLESGVVEVCALCGTGPVWNELPLQLQVDHIDGDRLNNLLENLRFLCPNCHTQQETSRSYRNRVAAAPARV